MDHGPGASRRSPFSTVGIEVPAGGGWAQAGARGEWRGPGAGRVLWLPRAPRANPGTATRPWGCPAPAWSHAGREPQWLKDRPWFPVCLHHFLVWALGTSVSLSLQRASWRQRAWLQPSARLAQGCGASCAPELLSRGQRGRLFVQQAGGRAPGMGSREGLGRVRGRLPVSSGGGRTAEGASQARRAPPRPMPSSSGAQASQHPGLETRKAGGPGSFLLFPCSPGVTA